MPSSLRFELQSCDGAARRGRVHLAHGSVETPAFMPVGTYGLVKGMTPQSIRDIGEISRGFWAFIRESPRYAPDF